MRKDFTPSERVAIARSIEAEIGSKSGERTDLKPRADWPEVKPGVRPRDIAAERAGFDSTTSYRRARDVVDKGTPELVKAMDATAKIIALYS